MNSETEWKKMVVATGVFNERTITILFNGFFWRQQLLLPMMIYRALKLLFCEWLLTSERWTLLLHYYSRTGSMTGLTVTLHTMCVWYYYYYSGEWPDGGWYIVTVAFTQTIMIPWLLQCGLLILLLILTKNCCFVRGRMTPGSVLFYSGVFPGWWCYSAVMTGCGFWWRSWLLTSAWLHC